MTSHQPTHRVLLVALVVVAMVACSRSTGSADSGAPETTSAATAGNATPSTGCDSTEPPPQSGETALQVDGEARSYRLTMPPGGTDEPVPLIVNLHGATGSSASQDSSTGFPELATTDDFVVLTPQAVEPARFWRLSADSPDPAFVLGLVDHVASVSCIDLSRVYVAGFSLGGMFAMKLACIAPDRIAAIGVVAGLIDLPCQRDRPVPMIAFQGTDDSTVRLDGTYEPNIQLLLQGASRPRPEIAASWATDNGCSGAPDVVEAPRSTATTYRCPEGSEVELVLTDGGTHHWPRLTPNPPPDGGPGDNAVDATQLMWEFMREEQR